MAFFNPVESTAKAAQTIIGDKNGQYRYSYDVYPEDLGSQQSQHFMKLTAYVGTGSTGSAGSGPKSAAYSAMLYIPSGSGSGGATMTFQDQHEYTDIKLTNFIERKYLGTTGISALGTLAKRAINPAIQVIYRSTDPRKFAFSFNFTPKSENESKALKNIHYNIRKFAAPDIGGPLNAFFITPAEWEISFYFNGKENTAIPKIKRCMLVDCSLDFAQQEWSTFKNGHPVSCMMVLSFLEMEIISRKYVTDGY